MSKPEIIIVFSPTFFTLLFLRIINSGGIYYTEPVDRYNQFLIKSLNRILIFFNIVLFSYRIGTAGYSWGFHNSIYKKATNMVEEFYNICGDKNLIEKFNQMFASKNIGNVWKQDMYRQIRRGILHNYYGILNNYSPQSIIYVPVNSCEFYVINKLNEADSNQRLKIKTFHKYFLNILNLLAYFVATIKRFLVHGVVFKDKNQKNEFKIMIEAVRPLEGGIMDWIFQTSFCKIIVTLFANN